MNERDEQILEHIGLYRISLRRTMERLFFGGRVAACDNVLRRLAEQDKVRAVDGLPHRLSYYQLTAAEAANRGLPPNRAGNIRPQAFHQHLAVLWFCCMGPIARKRLEPAEVAKIDPSIPAWPQVVHCLERGDTPRLYRVLVLGSRSRHADLVSRLCSRLTTEAGHPALGALSRRGLLGVAVLAEHGVRRAAIERAVERHGLSKLAPVVVEFAPGPATLPGALHGHC